MRQIHSLEDLREAKRDLAARKAIAQREFANHLDVLRKDTGSYFIKKILLPLSTAAIGAVAVKYFFFSGEKKEVKEQGEQIEVKVEKNRWLGYLNILLSVFRIYQNTFGNQESSGAGNQDNYEESISPKSFVQKFKDQKVKSEY